MPVGGIREHGSGEDHHPLLAQQLEAEGLRVESRARDIGVYVHPAARPAIRNTHLVEALQDEFEPPFILGQHRGDRVVSPFERRERPALQGGRCADAQGVLDLYGGFHEPGGRGKVAHPPSGHRVRLGEAVDGDGAIAHATERAEADMLPPTEDQLLVDLVGDDQEVALFGQLGDALQLRARRQSSGGVVRVRDDEQLRALGQDGADGVGLEGEVVLLQSRHVHHAAPGQIDHVVEGVEAGHLEHHFVPGIDQREDGDQERFLDAVGDDDLVVGIVESVVALEFA